MKMKMVNVIKAYQAADEMGRQIWPFETAMALVKVKRELRDAAEAYLASEAALIDAYAKKDEDGAVMMTTQTRFIYRDAEARAAYEAAHKELDESEAEVDITPRTISAPATIRPEQIEALEGVLLFRAKD